jgi:hypothetical protein
MKEGDEGGGTWLMDFIYLFKTELNNSCNSFRGVGRGLRGRHDGDNVNNDQCKSNQNCHYEPRSLYNEYILIKIF